MNILFRDQALEAANNSSQSVQNAIEFIAHLSSPLMDDESLALDVVDELRGKSNNITRYRMSKLNNDLTYNVVISGLEGTTLTYRYAKVGIFTINEMNAIGSLVRYRMAHFSGNLHIDDIIAGWTDGEYQGPTGNFTGSVIDKKSKLPVADVLICIAGRQFFTDANGIYTLLNIPQGTHNFVATSIDGAYQVFQQQVEIASAQPTTVVIELESNHKIKVRFEVTTPLIGNTEVLRIGGNVYQLGNTFADLNQGLSLQSTLMPRLERVSNGRYQLEVDLYAGSELRYFYSLGDGFWNVEQNFETIFGYRQLVLPQIDVTINDAITTWQVDGKTPIQFNFSAPQDTPENDTVSIQFKTDDWYEAIPMEQGQDGHWYFTLYSPLPLEVNLSYRFCRNNICGNLAEAQQELYLADMQSSNPFLITSQLSHWKVYETANEPTEIVANDIKKKSEDYLTGVEFLSVFNPSYISRIAVILDELVYKGVNTIVIQPTISVDTSGSVPVLYHLPGVDMLTHDLEKIIDACKQRNLNVILMPKIGLDDAPLPFVDIKDNDFFAALKLAYYNMELSYAQLAEYYEIQKIILNSSNFTVLFSGEFTENTSVSSEDFWVGIMNQCKEIYSGEVVFAIPYSQINDYSADIINTADAIYLILDQPFNVSNDSEFYINNKSAASLFIRKEISLIDQNYTKPIYIGISYPSDAKLISRCNMDPKSFCVDFSPSIFQLPLVVDGQTQVNFYNALLSELITCPYVDGVISRSFFYPLKLTDQSSSIFGKPAMDVLWYWYTGIK